MRFSFPMIAHLWILSLFRQSHGGGILGETSLSFLEDKKSHNRLSISCKSNQKVVGHSNDIHATIVPVGMSLQIGDCYSSQDSQPGKIGDCFSPLVTCIAVSSTMKSRQKE